MYIRGEKSLTNICIWPGKVGLILIYCNLYLSGAPQTTKGEI